MPNQAFDLLFYDIFPPQKVPLSKISDHIIVCDLWFGPLPNQNSWLRPGPQSENFSGGTRVDTPPQILLGPPSLIGAHAVKSFFVGLV